MCMEGKRGLGAAALCAGGILLLTHPICLAAFAAGAWAGLRGKDWLTHFCTDREAKG